MYHLYSIVSNVAVVPEFNYDGGLQTTDDYLVIQNRIQWLDYFYKFNCSIGAKPYPELFAAYFCADEDKNFIKNSSDSDDADESESEADTFGTDEDWDVSLSDSFENDSSQEEDTSDSDHSNES